MKKSLFVLSLILFSMAISAKMYVCTAPAAINIRIQPSTQGSVIGALQPNQSVEVIVIKGDWAMINYDGATAYVAAKFLTEQQSLPASRQIVSASVSTKVDKQEAQSAVVLQEGRLNINSNPTEAKLYVDSQYLGLTPYEMRLDCKNSHTIRLEKEGYTPFQQTILLDAGQTRNISATLQKVKVPKVKIIKEKPLMGNNRLFLGANIGGGFTKYDYKVCLGSRKEEGGYNSGGNWSLGVEGAYAITPMIGIGGYFSAGQSLVKENKETLSGLNIAIGALLAVGKYAERKAAGLFGLGYEYVNIKEVQDGKYSTPHLANLRVGCLLGCGVYMMCEAGVGGVKNNSISNIMDNEGRIQRCDIKFTQFHVGLRVGYNFGRFIGGK